MNWKPIKTNRRCVALDQDGKRCRRKAEWKGPYHGNPDFYLPLNEYGPGWVRVEFCRLHASKAK
jgi:hypothetical protein